MKIGMIGLGKMGLNLVQNLIHHQHQVVAYDLNTQLVDQAPSAVQKPHQLNCSLRNWINPASYG